MKLFSCVCASALLAASAGLASASTITLDSYGQDTSSTNSSYAAPTGVGNTALLISGGTTYDIGSNGIWAAATGGSSWVSQSPGNYPNGNNVEPSGTYTYTSTFTDTNAADSSGTITIMADDSSSFSINGIQLTAAAAPDAAAHCTVTVPNCETPVTFDLTSADFVNGTNNLSFGVTQDFGNAEGLDFSGSVSVTPEPNSLLLMATGLFAAGILVYRRRLTA